MFEVSTFHNVHTCSLDLRGKDNCQASPLIVAHLIKDKFATDGSDQLPSDIRKSMHKDYGIQMSYEKAWRCREKAIHLSRGTPEDSYSKLPSYLHMLQLRNPGTITDFVVEDGRFKYCFFSLGPSIRGFKFCRPVICVDGSFLKTRYGGQMLCAVALDAGSHIFPIAFAIVDSSPWRNSYDRWRSGLAGTYLHLRLVPVHEVSLSSCMCCISGRSIIAYTLCSPYYTTEYWRRTYEGTIMPVGDEDDWELPDDIKNMTVGVPVEKQPVGRPKKQKVGRIKNNRTACNGERIIKSRNCSMCGAKGHNRSTCNYRG
ncbi:uncharacterized protein LOC115720176 [Cannabis sativa]|uniref:uncharacterized protein LOC115720176 n=1 Tax=Cannabis sativa TaxID=3483 RepID=UPI0029CA4DBE|nr:uncharacterized protein LOC115720176 [Cannabis sativa]